MNILLRLIASLVLLLGLSAHSLADAPELRISAAELSKIIDQPKVVVIDARPAEEYTKGHIPGAHNLPFKKTFQDLSKNGLVLSSERAKLLFQVTGLKNDDLIVIYDGSNMVQAARVFWTLDMNGHEKLRLLEGGLNAWVAEGGALSQETPAIQVTDYRTRINHNAVKTWQDVKIAVVEHPGEAIIIDARDGEHFAGLKSEASRAGHIPGARSVPVGKNLTADGFFRPREELEALYGNIPKDQQVLVYCSKGLASSLEYFVLRELGIPVGNYESSWMEWGNKPELPIVNPTASSSTTNP